MHLINFRRTDGRTDGLTDGRTRELKIEMVREALRDADPMSLVFYALRMPRPRDRESFRGNSWKNNDFAHGSDVVARSGSRELRAFKIPASYHAWRPSKHRKNNSEKLHTTHLQFI